jgi:hypothetical protein
VSVSLHRAVTHLSFNILMAFSQAPSFSLCALCLLPLGMLVCVCVWLLLLFVCLLKSGSHRQGQACGSTWVVDVACEDDNTSSNIAVVSASASWFVCVCVEDITEDFDRT